MEKILKVYSLRWSIEVFFKECKQHLGWMNNQSANYVSTYASMHLAPIRYLLLLDGALRSIDGYNTLAGLRKGQVEKLTLLNYLGLLWELFTGLVYGILEELEQSLGSETISNVRKTLSEKLDDFIKQVFQFDLNALDPCSNKGF